MSSRVGMKRGGWMSRLNPREQRLVSLLLGL